MNDLTIIVASLSAVVLVAMSGYILRLNVIRELARIESQKMPKVILADNGTNLNDLSLEQLLDVAQGHRRQLTRVELAVCRQFGIKQGDDSPLNQSISAAVHDGIDHSRLLGDYNLRVYGARWGNNDRPRPRMFV